MNQTEKIDKIYEMVHAQNATMTEISTYQKTHAKTLEDHKLKIEILEAHRNNSIGAKTAWGIFCSFIGAGIMKIITLFHT